MRGCPANTGPDIGFLEMKCVIIHEECNSIFFLISYNKKMSRLSKKQFVFLNFTLNPSYNMLNSFEDSLKQGPATLLAWCYMKPKQEGELPFGIIPA